MAGACVCPQSLPRLGLPETCSGNLLAPGGILTSWDALMRSQEAGAFQDSGLLLVLCPPTPHLGLQSSQLWLILQDTHSTELTVHGIWMTAENDHASPFPPFSHCQSPQDADRHLGAWRNMRIRPLKKRGDQASGSPGHRNQVKYFPDRCQAS